MINGETVLAIVPARGGSKRLPRKNLLPLHGKPLIVWTIESGLKSKYVDRLIVSSDDPEILAVAKHSHAETIERPAALARDDTSIFPVVEDTLIKVETDFDILVLLQPTSPLRTQEHIDQAFALMVKKKADAIVSVSSPVHSPLWANTLPSDGNMVSFITDEVRHLRSQDLPQYFQINGALYICRTKRLLEEKSFFLKQKIFAYRMSRHDSIDIDEPIDFELATLIKSTT